MTAKNVWLRSMNIRLRFAYSPEGVGPKVDLDLGDLGTLTKQMNPNGPAATWQAIFAAMAEDGIKGI